MGQYCRIVNLDKRECLNPYALDAGAKAWEQLASVLPSKALLVLVLAQPEQRGGGDLDLSENWHGPERVFPKHNATPGPMTDDYSTVARRTIGRWAGDRIAVVGDYAEDSDLAPEHDASAIYCHCTEGRWLDVTADVLTVLAHELHENEGESLAEAAKYVKAN